MIRIVLGAALCCAGLSYAQPVSLYSGLAPPVSYLSQEDDQAHGMAVDMLREVISCSGDQAGISAHPWARAVKLWNETPYSGLFVADRTPEREHKYHWVGPIYRSNFNFYALKSSKIKARTFAELKTLGTIALPRDWQAVKRAKREGLSNILEVSDTSQLWPMLKSGHVKVIGSDELMLMSMSYETEQVDKLLTYTQINGYLALTKDIPEQQAKRWQSCFTELTQNGEYQRIYLKWIGHTPPD